MSAGYLLDTVVLSALAPARRIAADAAKQRARAWVAASADAIYLPVTAVAEVTAGIGEREAAGATRHAVELAAWLSAVLASYPDRILAFNRPAALHVRELAREARHRGVAPGFADLTIAAIAREHGLMVVTRNLRHFAPMGVAAFDPFDQGDPAP